MDFLPKPLLEVLGDQLREFLNKEMAFFASIVFTVKARPPFIILLLLE
jgi:hypothetical protein